MQRKEAQAHQVERGSLQALCVDAPEPQTRAGRILGSYGRTQIKVAQRTHRGLISTMGSGKEEWCKAKQDADQAAEGGGGALHPDRLKYSSGEDALTPRSSNEVSVSM